MRHSLASWFGRNTGGSYGVAIIGGRDKAAAISRAVQANALSRGVGRPIPIAVLPGYSAESFGFRAHELDQFFRAEHGVELGLIIAESLPPGELLSLSRRYTVLAIGDEAPVSLAEGSVVIAVADGRMTAARPASGKPWARAFFLETIVVGGVESLVLRPGAELPVANIWKPAPADPAPVAVTEPEPEWPIVHRVALVISRGELDPKVRLNWAAKGFTVVESHDAALAGAGDRDGRTEIVIAAGNDDQRPEEIRGRVNRLGEQARELGVSDRVVIRAA
ncbi:MAG: hypothetical protein ACR652_01300 [Methylocystis sp.]|uniref:hypothetical protein n=1 Tax=Methylocystis sp. TaxID=1911079 RepID=UPI003DA537C0